MKKFVFFALIATTAVLAGCQQGAKAPKEAPADTVAQAPKQTVFFDTAKVAALTAKTSKWQITAEDHMDLVEQADSIVSYFRSKYTRDQIAKVQGAVLHEEEILGAEDYKLFQTFYEFDCNLASQEGRMDSTASVAYDNYLIHRRAVFGF